MRNAERTLALDLAAPPCPFGKAILEVGPGESVEAVAAAIEQAVRRHQQGAAAAGPAEQEAAEEEAEDKPVRLPGAGGTSSGVTEPLLQADG